MIRTAISDDANTRAYLASLARAQPWPCGIVEYASAGDCLAGRRRIDLLLLDQKRVKACLRFLKEETAHG